MDVLRILHRPFAIEPNSQLMFTDGIFDSVFGTMGIGFYVQNTSNKRLRAGFVRPAPLSSADWKFQSAPETPLRSLLPGESQLVVWIGDFSTAKAGKKEFRVEFAAYLDDTGFGNDFDGFLEQRIFVSETTWNAQKSMLQLEVPEGRLLAKLGDAFRLSPSTLKVFIDDGLFVETDIGTILVPTLVDATWFPNPGSEDKLPFNDPALKVLAVALLLIFAVWQYIEAVKKAGGYQINISIPTGAVEENDQSKNGEKSICAGTWDNSNTTKNQYTMDVAKSLGHVGAGSMALYYASTLDTIDPWGEGREKHPHKATDPRRSERVIVKTKLPDLIVLGDQLVVETNWEYQATLKSGTNQSLSFDGTRALQTFASDKNISVPTTVATGEKITVELELLDPIGRPYGDGEIFGFALYTSPIGTPYVRHFRTKTDSGKLTSKHYTELDLTDFAAKSVLGRWKVELYVQNTNRALATMKPMEAAQFIGGQFLLAPQKFGVIEAGSTDTGCGLDQTYFVDVTG